MGNKSRLDLSDMVDYDQTMIKLTDKIRHQCHISEKNCWVWQGCSNGLHGKMKIRYSNHAGDKIVKFVNTHKLMYLAHHNLRKLDENISHLCSVGLCVNPAHLTVESMSSNLSRRGCVTRQQNCYHHPPCLL